MKIRYIIACAVLSLLIWCCLFLLVLKKPLTVGLYYDLFKHKTAHAEKSSAPRFFIIAGSNGLYSHDAGTFEKILNLPATNLSVAVMFPLNYLLERYQSLLKNGDIVYLPLEYSNYSGGSGNGSFGDVYDITIERNFSKLTCRRFYNCFARFDLNTLVESVAESTLAAAGVKPLVTAADLTDYGDIAINTRENAKPYISYIKSIPRANITFSAANPCIKEFLLRAKAKGITVIGGLPVNFTDTVVPEEVQNKIETLFTGNQALFVKAPNRSLYPRDAFFDTSYHLKRQAQINHSEIIAREMLKKYPGLFVKK